jgi:2-polyprenyl-3-methyl-5-hydroxy-6-metoxy-1,4-benzoquinol methylase
MQSEEPKTLAINFPQSNIPVAGESGLNSVDSALRYSCEINCFDESTHYGRLLHLVGRNKRVLELGSSTGYLTDAMQTHFDCEVLGVEIDGEAASLSRGRGNEVLQHDLDIVDLSEILAGRKFDVVLCADVLEHLRNPERLLRACYDLLEEDGMVVASIPNAAHADIRLALLGGQLPFRPMGLLDNTHVKFFTRASVEQLFEAACFQVVSVSRNRWGIGKTEVQPYLKPVKSSLELLLKRDPEAETYQFIVTCRKYRPSEKLQSLGAAHIKAFERIDIVILETGYQRADDIYQNFLTLINYPSSLLRFWIVNATGAVSLEKLVFKPPSYGDNDFRTFSFVKHDSKSVSVPNIGDLKDNDSDVSFLPFEVIEALKKIAQKTAAKYLFLLETCCLPGPNCIHELVKKAKQMECEGKSLPIVFAQAELTLVEQSVVSDEPLVPRHGFSGLLVPCEYILRDAICDSNLQTTAAQAQDMCLRALSSQLLVDVCQSANYFSNGSNAQFGWKEKMQDSLRMSRRWGTFRNFVSTVKYWFKQSQDFVPVLLHTLVVACSCVREERKQQK